MFAGTRRHEGSISFGPGDLFRCCSSRSKGGTRGTQDLNDCRVNNLFGGLYGCALTALYSWVRDLYSISKRLLGRGDKEVRYASVLEICFAVVDPELEGSSLG